MKFIPETGNGTNIDIYVLITITGSIPLIFLFDFDEIFTNKSKTVSSFSLIILKYFFIAQILNIHHLK
jgi:hypothetical protein